jgi:WD40 repeat protein
VRFDAFISYSHAADGMLAPAVQKACQNFAKPWHKMRALHVFRDETSLSANPHLWTSIEQALDDSAWFVLLASPEAAASEWVDRELAYWLTTRSAERILVVLTDGTMEWDRTDRRLTGTAVSPILGDAYGDEPRYVDLRWAKTETDLDAHNARFRAAIADIAAPMHGLAKDELASEDVRLHRRARRLARGAITALSVLLLLSLITSTVAYFERNRADTQARIATARALAARIPELMDAHPDIALLLAVEAHRLDDSPATQAALATALLHRPQLLSVVRPESAPYSSAIALPGGVVLAASANGVDRWTAADARPVRLVSNLEPLDMAINNDGTRVVIGAKDGHLRVIRTDDGSQVFETMVPDQVTVKAPGQCSPPPTDGEGNPALDCSPAHVAMSADGRFVAAAADGVVVIYDVTSGAEIPFTPLAHWAEDIAFGPRPGQLTTATTTNIYSWDIATGALRFFFSDAQVGGFQWFAMGGNHVVTGGTVAPYTTIIDIVASARLQQPLGTPADPSRALEMTQQTPLTTLDTPTEIAASPVTMTPDGGVAIGIQPSGNTDVVVAPIAGNASTIQPGVGSIRALSVSPDGSTLVITGDAVASWALNGLGSLAAHTYGPEALAVNGVTPAASTLTGGFSPDGTRVVLTAGQSVSRVLNAASGSPISQVVAGTARFADDNTLLSIRSSPNVLDRLRASDGSLLAPSHDLGSLSITSFAMSPTREQLAISNRTETFDPAALSPSIRIEQPGPNGEIVEEQLAEGFGWISGLAFSADGKRLVEADGPVVSVYNMDTGKLILIDGPPRDYQGLLANSVSISPDGNLLAVGTVSGRILLVDASKLLPISAQAPLPNLEDMLVDTLEDHTGPVVGVSFSPDGARLASLGSDGKMRLWDVSGRKPLGEALPTVAPEQLPSVRGGTLSFSVDGRFLLAPSDQGLTAWTVDPRDWDTTVCHMVLRNLTHGEWDTYVPPGTPYHETCPSR